MDLKKGMEEKERCFYHMMASMKTIEGLLDDINKTDISLDEYLEGLNRLKKCVELYDKYETEFRTVSTKMLVDGRRQFMDVIDKRVTESMLKVFGG